MSWAPTRFANGGHGASTTMTLVQHELAPEIIWFTPSEELLDDPPKMLTQIHETSFPKGMLG